MKFHLRPFAVCVLICLGLLTLASISVHGQGSYTTHLPIVLRQVPTSQTPTIADYRGLFGSTTDGDLDYFTVRPDGSELTNIIQNEIDDYDVTWSPDGKILAYENTEGTWVRRLDNNELTQLSSESLLYGYATWSPDGRYFVYSDNSETVPTDEIRYFYDVTTNVSATLGIDNAVLMSFTWAPTSTHLALVTCDMAVTPCRLWLVEAGSSTARLLATADSIENAYWSPDGQRLLFTQRTADNGTSRYSVWFAGLSSEATLIEDGYVASAWWQQGDSVLLWDGHSLYSRELADTEVEPFSITGQVVRREVAVSPDGQRVIYYEDHEESDLPYYRSINTVEPVALESACSPNPPANTGCTQQTTWSADGTSFLTQYAVSVPGSSTAGWILSDATTELPVWVMNRPNEINAHYLPSSSQFISSYGIVGALPDGHLYANYITNGTTEERITIPVAEETLILEWRYLP